MGPKADEPKSRVSAVQEGNERDTESSKVKDHSLENSFVDELQGVRLGEENIFIDKSSVELIRPPEASLEAGRRSSGSVDLV